MDGSAQNSAAGSFPPLNLPPAPLVRRGEEVLCWARRRYVRLEPEEWVRQHWLAYLGALGYPRGGMSVEHAMALHGQRLRADLLCHDRQGRPRLLAEFKAPDVRLNQAVVDQTLTYNLTLCAPIVLISNGIQHHAFAVPTEDPGGGKATVLAGIPAFVE
jgi:hypothetical protein